LLSVTFASYGIGNLLHVEGKMDSLKYQEVLGENVMPSMRKLKLGPFNRTVIPSIPQIPPRLGCRRSHGRVYSGITVT